MGTNTDWTGCSDTYDAAEKRIRESTISISNEMELGKKDTVSILTYLIHDIISINEGEDEPPAKTFEQATTATKSRVTPCPAHAKGHHCTVLRVAMCPDDPCELSRARAQHGAHGCNSAGEQN